MPTFDEEIARRLKGAADSGELNRSVSIRAREQPFAASRQGKHMSATLVLAIWIASNSTYQAALPFGGQYQLRQYANSESGIDDFMKWIDAPGHDKIDLICVAISGGEESKAAQFWRDAEVKRIFFMNPLQVEVLTKNPLIPMVNAITIAETCAEMFPTDGNF